MDILVTGDVYLGDRVIERTAEQGNAEMLFGDFSSIIQESTLSITNLESPIINEGLAIEKTGPPLKSSIKSLAVLKKAGFNLLTLANNHIMDFGRPGLLSTIRECDKLNLSYVGAGNTSEIANKPFTTIIGEKKISVLNFAENEFSTIWGTESYGANPMDPINNSYDIQRAKKESDLLIVIVHGGREHYEFPSPNFKKTLRFYADCGADAVIAHHTHCVSGYEVYNDKPIFYGIGNFLFNNFGNNIDSLWNVGLGIRFMIKDNNLVNFELLPYYQCRSNEVSIELMHAEEKQMFLGKVEELSKVITDDTVLEDQWKKYIDSQKKAYNRSIYIKNRWLRKFVNRGILPDTLFYNQKYKTLLINLIRCETHREILLDSLINRDID